MTRILSLDDEAEMLQLLGLMLESTGYEHLCTTDGNEALSILRTKSIDLFTQDMMRPNVDGWMLYELIKEDAALRHVPVLFISAGRLTPFAAKHLNYGDEYMTKPFSPSELLRRVKKMLERLGKHVPTEEERRARYEQIREELAKKFKMSEDQLDVVYERITGFLVDS